MIAIPQQERKRMEEVINILGSPSPWIIWINLILIGVLCWVIERLSIKIKKMEYSIEYMDRNLERQSRSISQLVRKMYGTDDQLIN